MERPSNSLVGAVLALVLVLVAGSLAGCSDPELTDEQRAVAGAEARRLASQAGITLGTDDADCLVDRRSDDLLGSAGGDSIDLEAVSRDLLDCVGPVEVARAMVLPWAGGLRTSSLECAAERMDRDVVEMVLSSAMAGDAVEPTTVELEARFVLAVCAELDELGQ